MGLQLPDNVAVVDAALSFLEQAKNAIERRQEDEKAVDVLRSIEGKGGLMQLLEQVASIEGMTCSSVDVKQLAKKKIDTLRGEIGRLQSFVGGLAKRISAANDLRSLEVVQSDILRHATLFDGSVHAAELEASLAQCKLLREFLESIDRLSRDAVSSPETANERIGELERLSQEYESRLSTEQETVLVQAVSKIKDQVREKEQTASRWLERCEKRFEDNDNLDELARNLHATPEFLPQADRLRLETLVNQVTQRGELRRQEAGAIATIRSVSAKGSLSELDHQLTLVESSSIDVPSVQAAAKEKLLAIRQEIDRIEGFRTKMAEGVRAANDLRSLEVVQSDILRHATLFDGSVHAAELEASFNSVQVAPGVPRID